jgi:hypothetical protein
VLPREASSVVPSPTIATIRVAPRAHVVEIVAAMDMLHTWVVCKSMLLPSAEEVVVSSGRPWYKGWAALLQGFGSVCCQQRKRLLPAAAGLATKGGHPCCKGLMELLPRSGGCCCQHRPSLIEKAFDLATKGGRTCCKGLAASVPWFVMVAACVRRRCYQGLSLLL